MPDLRVQNASLPVEGIRPLKADFELTDEIKKQLQNDGLDEVIFEKNGQRFIAFKDNLDLSELSVNHDAFNPATTNQMGQLFIDSEPVKVLFKDDEDAGSFWVQPYKALAGVLDEPWLKAGTIGLGAGMISGAFRQTSLGHFSHGGMTTLGKGVTIGGAVGTGMGILRHEAEVWGTSKDDSSDREFGVAIAGSAGFGLGFLGGRALHEGVTQMIKNPKATAIGAGITVAVVGGGLLIDYLSDNRKVPNYTVINRISNN